MKFDGYWTDKDASGYIPTYQGLAAMMPTAPAICELGVYRGGSLAMWKHLWPRSDTVIVGVDINPGATWPPGTVKVVMDQQDPMLEAELVRVLASEGGPGKTRFDMIVDDASHQGHATFKSFQHLWKLVAPGGYYVIEDWCVGFDTFPAYDDSMLSLAMMLINLFEDPATDVHFLNFVYGMIIIRKKDHANEWTPQTGHHASPDGSSGGLVSGHH